LKRAGSAAELRPAPKARSAAHPQERQQSAAFCGTRDRVRSAGTLYARRLRRPASGNVSRAANAPPPTMTTWATPKTLNGLRAERCHACCDDRHAAGQTLTQFVVERANRRPRREPAQAPNAGEEGA
jgi:hypothetical protein